MAKQILYVIQKWDWQFNGKCFARVGEIPVKAFADRTEAYNSCDQWEKNTKIDLSGTVANENERFSSNLSTTFGSLREITSLSIDRLVHGLKAIGVPEPPRRNHFPGDNVYQEADNDWWILLWQIVDSANQHQTVWRLFDRIRFYDVVEVEWLW